MLAPLYFFIVFLIIRPQDWYPFLLGLPTANIVIPIGLILGYLNIKKNDRVHYVTPVNTLLIMYLAVILLSTTINVGVSTGVDEFIKFFKRYLVFLLVLWNVNTLKELVKVYSFLLLTILVVAYNLIIQILYGQAWGGLVPYLTSDGESRAVWYGQWDGPNVVCLILLIGAAISLSNISDPDKKKILRVLGVASFVLCVLAIYYTNSRGGVLSLLVGMGFYFRQYFLKPKLIIIGVAAITAVLTVMPSRMSEVSSDEASAHERVYLWETGLSLLRKNPLLGIGRNEFKNNNGFRLIAHNNYVQDFSELGSIGFLIYLAIFFLMFKWQYLIRKVSQDKDLTLILNVNMTILAMYATCTYFIVYEHGLLFFVLGMSASTISMAYKMYPQVKEIIEIKISDFAYVLSLFFMVLFTVYLAAVVRIL